MSFAEYAFPFAGALPQFDLQPVQSLPRPSDIEGDTTQELTPSSAERDVAGSALTPKGDRSNEKCPPQENEPVPRWFCEFRKRPALFDSLMHCGVIGILALWLSIPLNTPDGDADTSNYWIFILGFFTLYHFTGSYNAYCLNRQFDPFGFSSKRLLYTGEILNSVLPICLSVLAYFLPSEWRRAVTSSKIWFVYLVTAGLFPISIAYFLHCLLARRVYETNLSPEELSRDRAKPWGDAFADLRRPVPLKVVFWFIVATMLVIATFVVGQVYSYLFFRYYPLPTWLAVVSLCLYQMVNAGLALLSSHLFREKCGGNSLVYSCRFFAFMMYFGFYRNLYTVKSLTAWTVSALTILSFVQRALWIPLVLSRPVYEFCYQRATLHALSNPPAPYMLISDEHVAGATKEGGSVSKRSFVDILKSEVIAPSPKDEFTDAEAHQSANEKNKAYYNYVRANCALFGFDIVAQNITLMAFLVIVPILRAGPNRYRYKLGTLTTEEYHWALIKTIFTGLGEVIGSIIAVIIAKRMTGISIFHEYTKFITFRARDYRLVTAICLHVLADIYLAMVELKFDFDGGR